MTLQGSISLADGARINNLLVFEVTNASFEGPGISGKIVPPAGDWIQIMPDGTWKLDVRMNATLDDGSLAVMQYNGIVRMTDALMERVAAGDELTSEDLYFRATPYVETNSEKYAWLNQVLCVGKLRSFQGGRVVYDIFEVL